MKKVLAVILISVAAAIAVAALSACNKKDGSTAVVANSYDMRAGKYKGRNDIYKVTIEDGVTDIPSNAFEDCNYLIMVDIPASVTKIGFRAFFGCDNLTRISFSANVTEIDDKAFAFCKNLASIKVDENNKKYKSENDCLIEKETDTLVLGCINSIIPDHVTKIADKAFYGSGLKSITIPGSVTEIGEYAFEYCSLESVTIENGVTKIGHAAFFFCKSLSRIVIPNSVTEIGEYAFCGCDHLSTITFNGTVAEWQAVSKGNKWDEDVRTSRVYCTDGEATI